MSNENNNTSNPNEAPKKPVADKPDVPKPAGPIGTLPPNYTTHAEKPPKGTVRVTEGLEKGGETKKE